MISLILWPGGSSYAVQTPQGWRRISDDHARSLIDTGTPYVGMRQLRGRPPMLPKGNIAHA